MTVEFDPPVRRGGAVRITMVARIPVAEISLNGSTYELHFHPLADKLAPEEFALLKAAGKAEVDRMNKVGSKALLALFDVTTRLTS
jgi:hypothetical protein